MRPPGPTASGGDRAWASISSTWRRLVDDLEPGRRNSATSGTTGPRRAWRESVCGARCFSNRPPPSNLRYVVVTVPRRSVDHARRSGVRRVVGISSGGPVRVVAEAAAFASIWPPPIALERGERAAFVGHDPHVDHRRRVLERNVPGRQAPAESPRRPAPGALGPLNRGCRGCATDQAAADVGRVVEADARGVMNIAATSVFSPFGLPGRPATRVARVEDHVVVDQRPVDEVLEAGEGVADRGPARRQSVAGPRTGAAPRSCG